MDAENQIDNNSLMDSLLYGNDDSAIGGDAVPSSTSDGVNKSSKRMQYFGAVFNLANTVRNSFFHYLSHFFLLTRTTFVSKQALGAGILAMPYAFEQSGLAMGLLIIVAVVTLCALSQEIVILGTFSSFLSLLYTHTNTHNFNRLA